MNKKTMKIISVLFIAIYVIMAVTPVFAANTTNSVQQALSPIDMKTKVDHSNTGDIGTIGGKIMGIIQTVGVVLAVLVLMILGVKYMMGSAEEKAEYKKTMIPYIIGAVLIFAASTIANAIYNFAIAI